MGVENEAEEEDGEWEGKKEMKGRLAGITSIGRVDGPLDKAHCYLFPSPASCPVHPHGRHDRNNTN